MASPNYVREKLYVAADALAVSAAPIQQRVEGAYKSAFWGRLRVDDFDDPDDRELFAGIEAAMTARPAVGNEGSVRATTRAMSDEEAVAVARMIMDLHGRWFPLSLVDPERGES